MLAVPVTASEENPVVSPELEPGQTWSVTFNETGTLDYHCHPHPWMVAQITVGPSSGRASMNWTIAAIEPEGKDFEEWTWSPAKLTVEVGDTVTWINNGSLMHKVQETTAEHADHIGGVEDDHSSDAEAHAAEESAEKHTEADGARVPWWGVPFLFSGFLVMGFVYWMDRRS